LAQEEKTQKTQRRKRRKKRTSAKSGTGKDADRKRIGRKSMALFVGKIRLFFYAFFSTLWHSSVQF